MKKPVDDERSRIASLRYEVIAPLVNRPLPRGVQNNLLDDLTSQMHLDAKNRLVYLGKRTIERYLSHYQKFGFDGLKPKAREEQASLKAFPSQALDEAVKLRLAQPVLSADSLIDILCSQEDPNETGHRHRTLRHRRHTSTTTLQAKGQRDQDRADRFRNR